MNKSKFRLDPVLAKYEHVHQIVRPQWMKQTSPCKHVLNKLFPHSSIPINACIDNLLSGLQGSFFEAGCGRGELLLSQAQRFWRLEGCDFSKIFLHEANKKVAQWYRLHHSSGVKIKVFWHDLNYHLPYDNASFDAAAAIAVAEHVFDIYTMFNELRRILKPHGLLIVQVPNAASFKHRLRLMLGKPLVTQLAPPSRWCIEGYDGGHIHYFTQDSLAMVLRECGFHKFRWTGSGTLAQIRSLWPSLLSGDLICAAQAIGT